MGIRVGIDLGTTYTKIAYVDNFGNAVGLNNMEGTHMTPSVVFFESPEDIVVGQTAKELVYLEPEKAVCGIKRLIGKSNFAINFQGEDLSPEEVAAFIIKKVTNDASMLLGEDIDEAVIAVPTYWGINEVMAIRNAGAIAGIDKVSVVTETTAAALAYSVALKEQNQAVLIYDLGGSSFQVAVAAFNGTDIRVICSDGDDELGGRDWDDVIYKYLEDEFCAETSFDGDFDIYAQQDLRLKAERAKQQLSSREEVRVLFDAAGLCARISISRTTFEEITQTLLNESIEKTDEVIASAESKGYKIDEIILVGGSSLMPQVRNILVKKYGIEPKIYEPDLSIAKGAAIYASLYANEPPMPIHICSDDYAILVTAKGKNVTHNISIKDWKLSDFFLGATRSVGLIDYDGGQMEFSIYEYNNVEAYSTQDCINKNKYIKLAEFAFDNSDSAIPAFIQIELTLSIKGTIRICCKKVNDGKESIKVRLKAHSKLNCN